MSTIITSQRVRVRIAPSPSGHLHVGTARTAVYNWLFARHQGGTFILRIEDTDPTRSFSEMVDSIKESLLWLGLKWDEGPYFQSQRLELYRQAAEKLYGEGKAYYCCCTPAELEARRKEALAAGGQVQYDRRCRHLTAEEMAAREAEGRPKALRIAIPEGATTYHDLVLGEMARSSAELDDFVILRADGYPTYNFACAVDDADMRITHVIRGNDHIINTFKQVVVYQALGLAPPQFAHLPLLLGKDKRKISKREGAVAVTDYRSQGYLPEALLNFLALLGWSPGDDREFLPRDELVAAFSLGRINASNAVFDTDKLDWLNGEYIRATDDNRLLTMLMPILMESGLATRLEIETRWHWMLTVVRSLKERLKHLTDCVALGRFYFTERFDYEEKGIAKHFRQPGVIDDLETLAAAFTVLPEEKFTQEATEQALRALAEKQGKKPAQLIHPLRLALTGMTTGPGMFEIMDILGKARCLARLGRAVEFIRTLSGSAASW